MARRDNKRWCLSSSKSIPRIPDISQDGRRHKFREKQRAISTRRKSRDRTAQSSLLGALVVLVPLGRTTVRYPHPHRGCTRDARPNFRSLPLPSSPPLARYFERDVRRVPARFIYLGPRDSSRAASNCETGASENCLSPPPPSPPPPPPPPPLASVTLAESFSEISFPRCGVLAATCVSIRARCRSCLRENISRLANPGAIAKRRAARFDDPSEGKRTEEENCLRFSRGLKMFWYPTSILDFR